MKAFPITWFGGEVEKPTQYVQEGMELRDYFAAKALQGMAANPDDGHNPFEHEYEDYAKQIAESSYVLADAMMEARK